MDISAKDKESDIDTESLGVFAFGVFGCSGGYLLYGYITNISETTPFDLNMSMWGFLVIFEAGPIGF